ncbi:MAG: hypothetical protein ACK5O7_03460 [Holosporales bacterium]
MKLSKRAKKELSIYGVIALTIVVLWMIATGVLRSMQVERDQLSAAIRDLQLTQPDLPKDSQKEQDLNELTKRAAAASVAPLNAEVFLTAFIAHARQHDLKVIKHTLEAKPQSVIKGRWPFAITILKVTLEGETDRDIFQMTQNTQELKGIPMYLTSLMIRRVDPETAGVMADLTYELWHAVQ